MTTAPHNYFASTYGEARQKFLATAEDAGAVVSNNIHPLKGPTGEELALDVAAFGPLDAERVFVTMSATHGGEGFIGSAAQVGWMDEDRYRDLPDNTSVILMHAVNPHGFAWLRRVTEGNVDLNRNFLDYAEPTPQNPEYDKLHGAICPDDWTDSALTEADSILESYAEEHGQKALNRVVMGGQFSRPDGLFYGGTAPTWSRTNILATLDAYTADADHVALIDFHTGLGPSGHGECYIVGDEGEPGVEKANEIWGTDGVTVLAASGSRSAHDGYNLTGMGRELAPTPFYGNTLEFGTHPLDVVYRALRADNWLHLHGDLNSEAARSIKAELKEAFSPDSEKWRETVYTRSIDVWSRGMAGLAGL